MRDHVYRDGRKAYAPSQEQTHKLVEYYRMAKGNLKWEKSERIKYALDHMISQDSELSRKLCYLSLSDSLQTYGF